jgi:nicotinamide riboside kinase
MTLIVNLFGGPGSGKSVLARQLSVELDIQDIKTEYVTEYAKELTWGGLQKVFDNQLYVFAKQHNKQFKPLNQVDVIVTDSPLLMSLVYVDTDLQYFRPLVFEVFNKNNNLNILLERRFQYKKYGRNQTEEEAKQVDEKIVKLLNLNSIEYEKYSDFDYSPEVLAKHIKTLI